MWHIKMASPVSVVCLSRLLNLSKEIPSYALCVYRLSPKTSLHCGRLFGQRYVRYTQDCLIKEAR